jgi:BASS family bile acid:Na+ symporter
MLSDTLMVVTQVGMLVFVVTSMAAMGLGLTMSRIMEPLRDVRMVALLLIANFVVVPAVAIATSRVLPMESAAATALILIGCTAGAPFLPKLAQLAKGDPALAVGGMVLLMVVTVLYAPIVVPLAVEGATVDPWEIASSLILFMIVPLSIGLVVRARYPDLASGWVGSAAQISSVALLIGIGAALLVTWRDIIGAIGSYIFIAVGVLLLASLAIGFVAGYGRSRSDKAVLSFATAQRNIAAALVIAASIGGDVIVFTLVGALVIPIILIVLAGEHGRRQPAVEADPREADSGEPDSAEADSA